ncbi:helix-turn-helix domain-containing protein [Chryseobacterium nematophagum]|nr:helix-turn-helix transcriptional regulator [Chryseobacterium nematophagum]
MVIISLLSVITMMTFGKKRALLRKDLGLSQTELAKSLNTSVSVISRYERDEMAPSVDTAKKLAELLGSTVGYLLGEMDKANLFKDPAMLQRLSELENMPNEDKTHNSPRPRQFH